MLLVLDRSLFRLSTSLTVFLTSDVSKVSEFLRA